MKPSGLWTHDRGVSPVVGVALLIAITVILAAVIGGVVLGLNSSSVEAPQASLEFEHDGAGTLTISHTGGDPIDGDNAVVRGDDLGETNLGSLSAGESVNISANSGQDVSVVWQDPNSDEEMVLGTYSISS